MDKNGIYINPTKEHLAIFIDGEWRCFFSREYLERFCKETLELTLKKVNKKLAPQSGKSTSE